VLWGKFNEAVPNKRKYGDDGKCKNLLFNKNIFSKDYWILEDFLLQPNHEEDQTHEW